MVEEDLAKTDAGQDEELLLKAKELLDAIQSHAPGTAGVIGVDLEDIKGASLKIKDIIATGTSMNQRNKIKLLKDIIKKVCERHQHGKAPIEEVYAEAEKECGIDRTHAEEHISKMRQRGDLFAPDKDHIKIVNK